MVADGPPLGETDFHVDELVNYAVNVLRLGAEAREDVRGYVDDAKALVAVGRGTYSSLRG